MESDSAPAKLQINMRMNDVIGFVRRGGTLLGAFLDYDIDKIGFDWAPATRKTFQLAARQRTARTKAEEASLTAAAATLELETGPLSVTANSGRLYTTLKHRRGKRALPSHQRRVERRAAPSHAATTGLLY